MIRQKMSVFEFKSLSTESYWDSPIFNAISTFHVLAKPELELEPREFNTSWYVSIAAKPFLGQVKKDICGKLTDYTRQHTFFDRHTDFAIEIGLTTSM